MECFPYGFYIFFSLCNFSFKKLIQKMMNVCFLWFDNWTSKIWKSAKRQNHSVWACWLFTQVISLLEFWHVCYCHIYFFCEIPRYVQSQNNSISFDGLSRWDYNYMEVGQPAYGACREWWKLGGSVLIDQKFSREWNYHSSRLSH